MRRAEIIAGLECSGSVAPSLQMSNSVRVAKFRGRRWQRFARGQGVGLSTVEMTRIGFARRRSRELSRTVVAAVVLWALLGSAGCRRKSDDEGTAPPPVVGAKPGACASGGGVPGDPLSAPFFPRVVGDYCVDPNADARAYGDGAKGNLDEMCTELLDGECEVYKSYGLKRIVTLRYVDGRGSPAAVEVKLSRFASREGAFGFYTKRVVADADPLAITLTELHAGASGALGSGIAYVWRGEHLGELSYTNELEPPDKMKESAKQVLPDIARAVGEKLPLDASPLPPVALLPEEHRLPMGVSYLLGDLFGMSGLGPGAIGFYKDGDKRWRVVVLVRADEDSAEDVLASLKKVEHASVLKEVLFPALAFQTQHDDASPRTEYLAGRRGKNVFAVGDEDLVLGGGRSKEEEAKTKLSRDEKLAVLKRLAGG